MTYTFLILCGIQFVQLTNKVFKRFNSNYNSPCHIFELRFSEFFLKEWFESSLFCAHTMLKFKFNARKGCKTTWLTISSLCSNKSIRKSQPSGALWWSFPLG
ncbi:hypothetical protein J5N97_020001 [Dioscorea zingiberensis]|uniref:Uncharacterized protein n=1 Tax=Dioscorea zingiberensis TaxID=325984 RepID=A0A9D5CG42_9LILI|nr:hypothetical protein J5N97_020001 [Dioscorea zingiberensis]